MSWRHEELSEFGAEVIALYGPKAHNFCDRAMRLCSQTRYGLDETKFPVIEQMDVEELGMDATAWLADRLGAGDLVLVFGPDEGFQLSSTFFLSHWQDLFGPARDDLVIVPVDGGWALFYCHEDEFEFARMEVDQNGCEGQNTQ